MRVCVCKCMCVSVNVRGNTSKRQIENIVTPIELFIFHVFRPVKVCASTNRSLYFVDPRLP